MKKTIAMAFAIPLFFACSNQKTEDKAAVTTDSAAATPAKATAYRNWRFEVCGDW